MYEYEATIPTLWGHVMGSSLLNWLSMVVLLMFRIEFAKLHPEFIAEDNSLGFMSPNNGESYNLCHCVWIFPRFGQWLLIIVFFVSLEQLRDCRYGVLAWACVHRVLWISGSTRRVLLRGSLSFVLFFESCASHFLPSQRWGDAPVHSIAAALFASRDQIQFFDDIGYEHNPYTHCPKDKDVWEKGRCSCDPARSFGGSFDSFFFLIFFLIGFIYRLWWIFVYE